MLVRRVLNDDARITVLSIVGQHKLYATLSDFLGIIGYWAGDF